MFNNYFQEQFYILKNKKILLIIENYFLFSILKNKTYDIFRLHFLIILCYFQLFSESRFKK